MPTELPPKPPPGRTAVLLGAGASVEADVPISVDVTRRIVEEINGDGQARHSGAADALNFAVGALIGHDAAKGGNPYAGVDVERLFSAIQMLADRDSLEIAPFISEWHPAVSSFGPARSWPSFVAQKIEKALVSRSAGQDLEKIIRELIESQSGRADADSSYRHLEQKMVGALRRVIVVTGSVDYLAPLLNLCNGAAPLTIASLNYDLAIEALCESKGVSWSTGIESWTDRGGWAWSDERVRLLKLHGSINWRWRSGGGVSSVGSPKPSMSQPRADGESLIGEVQASEEGRGSPVVVFGQRGKVRADGPFLSMLREFDIRLDESDYLIVVGYSFRDEHINIAIDRWLARKPESTLVVIDPSTEQSLHSFLRDVKWRVDPQAYIHDPKRTAPKPRQRLFRITENAGAGLAQLLRPPADVESQAEVAGD